MQLKINPVAVHAFFWLMLILFSLSISAQKLPARQEISLQAPAKLKVDGKITEWEPLQAYNNSVRMFYSVANDRDNLYFAIKANDEAEIKKILVGNITLTICINRDRKSKDNQSVTFPSIKGTGGTSIGIKLTEPAMANTKQRDSVISQMNADYGTKAKEIALHGFNQLADSILSVYNEEGIKAIGAFNTDKQLCFEIAIPLKYLALSLADVSKLSYNIKLNGLPAANIVTFAPGNAKGISFVTSTPRGLSPTSGNYQSYMYPTDFWGEYTLIK